MKPHLQVYLSWKGAEEHEKTKKKKLFLCVCAFVVLKVMRCSKIASVKVSEITELIIKALENDKAAR